MKIPNFLIKLILFLNLEKITIEEETMQVQNTETDTQICGGFLEFDQNYPEIKKKNRLLKNNSSIIYNGYGIKRANKFSSIRILFFTSL